MAKSPEFPGVSEKMQEAASPSTGQPSISPSQSSCSLCGSRESTSSNTLHPILHSFSLIGPIRKGRQTFHQAKKALHPNSSDDKINGNLLSISFNVHSGWGENDQTKTTCEACNITFSRHETPHGPWNTGAVCDATTLRSRVSFQQVPVMQRAMRTRKRRKDVRDVPAWTGSKAPASQQRFPRRSQPQQSLYLSQEATEGAGRVLLPKMRSLFRNCLSTWGNLPGHEQMCPVSKCEHCSFTRLLLQGWASPSISAKSIYPVLKRAASVSQELLDYHECTVCKISFNKSGKLPSPWAKFLPGHRASANWPGSARQQSVSNPSEAKQPDVLLKASPCEKMAIWKAALPQWKLILIPIGCRRPESLQRSSSAHRDKEENKHLFLPQCLYPGAIKAKGADQLSPYTMESSQVITFPGSLWPSITLTWSKSTNAENESPKARLLPMVRCAKKDSLPLLPKIEAWSSWTVDWSKRRAPAPPTPTKRTLPRTLSVKAATSLPPGSPRTLGLADRRLPRHCLRRGPVVLWRQQKRWMAPPRHPPVGDTAGSVVSSTTSQTL